jgi:succinyl-CoA synthetase beta subunit
MHPEYVVKA